MGYQALLWKQISKKIILQRGLCLLAVQPQGEADFEGRKTYYL